MAWAGALRSSPVRGAPAGLRQRPTPGVESSGSEHAGGGLRGCRRNGHPATAQPWGGGIRTLETGLPQFDDLAFSPDGRLLVYWANSDPAAGDGRLYTMPNDGSSPPVQLTTGP